LQLVGRQAGRTFLHQSNDRFGERAPLAKPGVATGPKSLIVELGNTGDRVMARVVVVAGEIAMLAEQSPGGHRGTAGDFQEFFLGQDFLSFERIEDVLEMKDGGTHGSVRN